MMKIDCRGVAALSAFLVWGVSASAQSPAEPQTQDALVRDALVRYQAGLEAIESGRDVRPRPDGVQAGRPVRDLRLTDAVQLALEKNLDIAVERLNPQSVDLQIAGLRNSYLPVATSTIGQRDNTSSPATSCRAASRCRSRPRPTTPV